MSFLRIFSRVLCIFFLSINHIALADSSLQSTIQSPHRAESSQQRDQYRHPAATLDFFGITSEMKVVEIWPGRGWYTEILAPWLKQGNGQLIAAGFPAETQPAYRQALRQEYNVWLKASPKLFDEVVLTEFGPEAS